SINLLVSRASGDRENLKIELEKIYYYSLSNNSIELENIKKLTNLAENYSVGELADSYLSKNIKNVSKILNENNYSDEDCILILRTILNKSKRLLNIIEKYNQTKDLDKTLSTIKPTIFWKDKENVKIQANSWNLKDLKNNIYKINGLESLIKTNSKSSLNILSDFIVNFQ
ncbi:DNA polymerase III subunit delta, partial [Candidatus Pelagibacter sp.]|nr:DNA polymerase III subunit delta [Candidatus Pelagibacter sp.]